MTFKENPFKLLLCGLCISASDVKAFVKAIVDFYQENLLLKIRPSLKPVELLKVQQKRFLPSGSNAPFSFFCFLKIICTLSSLINISSSNQLQNDILANLLLCQLTYNVRNKRLVDTNGNQDVCIAIKLFNFHLYSLYMLKNWLFVWVFTKKSETLFLNQIPI